MNAKGLELLRFNHAGALVLDDGRTINYGVITIEHDILVYYTGKGLRELWSPSMTPEQERLAEKLRALTPEDLRTTGHVDSIPLERIRQVLY